MTEKSQKHQRVAVVLLSYRRPELTKQAAENILRWDNLSQLYISIDGLRSNAVPEERVWWEETRAVANSLGAQDPRISLNLRDENTGLTNHVVQALELAFSAYSQCILLEEDVLIDDKGLDFLASAVGNSTRAQGGSAFTRSQHGMGGDVSFRKTYFPELWGMSLNYPFFVAFQRMWETKLIDRRRVFESLKSSFPSLSRGRLEAHVDWWMRLFNSALHHPTHQDAIFAATAMELGVPWNAPWESKSRDGAHGDLRSLHPRSKRDDFTFPHAPRASNGFCLECEKTHGRIHLSSLRRRVYELLYTRLKGLG